MANISISLEGIDQAIDSLNYRPGSIKQRAIMAIRTFYTSNESIQQLHSLDTNILIKSIWDLGDHLSKLKAKRRNFSSIKSSINADLEKLSQKGQNRENIIIADSNVFDMSQEAKNDLFNSFADAFKTGDINFDQATDLLKAVTDFLKDYQTTDADNPDEDVEKIELDEDKELEEIKELDEDVEEIELDEDEELEEIEELDEDVEEIELDEDELKALEEFREKKELAEHFDDTLGQREKKLNKYVTVPEGKYTIGTKKSLKSSMELQPFDMPEVYIGMYPVSNSLFEIFIEQTGYTTTAENLGYGRVYHSRFKKDTNGLTWNKNAGSEDIKGACWYHPFGPDSTLHGKRNHPVVQVSVDDAITFAAWIGRRLPTEAEWEAAARTDLGYTYPWGNEFNPNALNIEQSGLSDTCAVDEYDAFANEFKIVDMLGNVMEWTADMETPSIKSKKNTRYSIAKGAAWNANNNVTISSRALLKNGFISNTIGFRCISEIFS